MKKLILSSLVSLAISFSVKAQAPPSGYPNINTNFINTLTVIQQYLLTNVTFLSNLQYSLSTNNNTWIGSNFFTTVYANNLRLSTNAWAGPTNTIDLNIGSQDYITLTSMQITGFANTLSNFQGSVVLNVTNKATTNVTMYLDSSVTSDDGQRSYIVTNGTLRVFSLRQAPQYTNNVSRTMF